MKSIIKLIVIASFINLLNLKAQNTECGGYIPENISNQQSNSMMSQTCTSNSADYINNYQLQSSYIPATNPFVGQLNMPINIIVLAETNGTSGAYTPTQFANEVFAFDWLNRTHLNTDLPSDPVPGYPSNYWQNNSKFKYEFNQVYFYNNSTMFNAPYPTGVNQLMAQHFSQHPEAKNFVNCFIVKRHYYYSHFTNPNTGLPDSSSIGGYASTYTDVNNNVIPIVVTHGWDDPNIAGIWLGNYWYWADHLPHELGHLFNLMHTYTSPFGCCSEISTGLDLLTDVFFTPIQYETACNDAFSSSTDFCTNNMMSGHQENDFLSPLQMGRIHRNLRTIPKQVSGIPTIQIMRHFAYGYSPIPHEITGNETWDFTYKSYNDIVVKKGATLTLTCRLEMVKEAAIIVEQGGLLVVDGATITSARSAGPDHEGLWQGIKVWGTSNKSQYQLDPQGYYYQGRVEVRNGAIIENAEVAIEANRPGYWIYGGGIIKIVGSTIRNCWKGVHFTMYTYTNSASYIRNSTFETTADLINGDVPQTFIEGWAFKGVKVNGCIFRNTNPNATSLNQLGKGIYLESAKGIITGLTTATVTDFCDETNPNWQPNIFENLYKGVELVNYGMQQTNGIFTSTVTRNYFKNCVYGVECKGMPAVSINQNKIVLGGNSVYNTYNEGIVHKSYTGFSVSENCVSQVGSNAAYTGGIIITEVGGDNNEVYRNKSFDNEYAYLSNGKNKTAAPTNQKFKGLQFLCNQNSGMQEYDIAIEGDGSSPTNPMNGIRLYQGGSGNSQNPYSAANLFTHYCPNSASDIYNNTVNPLIYFHYTNSQQIPSCYSWNVTPVQSIDNNCPTKFGWNNGGGIFTSSQKSLLLADFAVKNSQYLAVALLYNNIIDNGNTQSLLQSISAALPANSVELKNVMLGNSPNLSDAVVQELIHGNTILQNSDLLSIIAANPDVAHNEELLRMLRDKTNPMDEWMIEFLREAGTYETNRTLLEQTFAQKQYEREEIAWQMVRHLLSDTIADTLNHTELHEWLNIIGSPRAKYMIADDYASMGEFNAATDILNNINERNLDRYEIQELNGIKSWLLLQNTLFNEGRNIYELTSAELESIRTYAENERMYGLAGTFAANVLNHYEPESYVLKNIYPANNSNARTSNSDAQTKKKRTLKKLVENVLVSKPDLSVYPNPVNNQLSIDLSNIENVSTLSIYSLKGDLISSQNVQGEKLIKINTSGLANGSYNLQLKDIKGNNIKSEKLIVNHN